MGVNAYATSDEHQAELDKRLETIGLNSNLRWCNIDAWTVVFEYCTGTCICELQWEEVSSEDVITFLQKTVAKKKEVSKSNMWGVAEDKLFRYLEVCVEYNAHLIVC